MSLLSLFAHYGPVRAPGLLRIDPLRFLAGCRKKRLHQALSVMSLSLGFFWCIRCGVRDSFMLCYFYVICVFCHSVVLVRLSVSVQVIHWKDSSPKWPVLTGTLNPTLSLTHSLAHYVEGHWKVGYGAVDVFVEHNVQQWSAVEYTDFSLPRDKIEIIVRIWRPSPQTVTAMLKALYVALTEVCSLRALLLAIF